MYQLLSSVALVISALMVSHSLIKKAYRREELLLIFLTAIPSFIIGARCLNYLINYENYQQSSIPLWAWRYAGFSVYGGILASLFCLVVVLKLMRRDLWEFIDTLWIPFAVAFSILRLGCYFNGCCYGIPTKVFWGMTIHEDSPEKIVLKRILGISIQEIKVHPTQLYELGGAIFVMMTVFLLRKIWIKKHTDIPSGVSALSYGIGFTIMRLVVLPFRDLPYPSWIQNMGYPIFYISLILLSLILIKNRFTIGNSRN